MNRSARNGATFEADIEAFNATLTGWYWHRNHPAFIRTAKGWKPDEKGPPDFIATRAGVSVLFDAKSVEGERWPVSLIRVHQTVALDRHQAAGGVSGILLRLRSQGAKVDRWLPWAVVSPVFWAWWDAPESRAGVFSDVDGVAVTGCDWVSVIT